MKDLHTEPRLLTETALVDETVSSPDQRCGAPAASPLDPSVSTARKEAIRKEARRDSVRSILADALRGAERYVIDYRAGRGAE